MKKSSLILTLTLVQCTAHINAADRWNYGQKRPLILLGLDTNGHFSSLTLAEINQTLTEWKATEAKPPSRKLSSASTTKQKAIRIAAYNQCSTKKFRTNPKTRADEWVCNCPGRQHSLFMPTKKRSGFRR